MSTQEIVKGLPLTLHESIEAGEVAAKPGYRLGYLPALDGLRGISVLMVLAFHANLPFARGGHIGVDIFFVLSGFLITSLLAQEWRQTGAVSFKNFYARRALRLFPALAILLVACSLYAFVFLNGESAARTYSGAIYAGLYVANWAQAFISSYACGVLSHCWSLSIEEQFYMIWPPLFIALLNLRLKRGHLITGLLVGIGIIALHRVNLWAAGVPDHRLYFALDTRADALLVGCVGGLLVNWGFIRITSRWNFPSLALAACGGLFLLGWLAVGSEKSPLYCGAYLLVSFSALILILLLVNQARGNKARRLFELPALRWIGHLSYSLYLWHFPVFVACERLRLPLPLQATIQFLVSFALASISYYFIERPFLNLKSRFAVKVRAVDKGIPA